MMASDLAVLVAPAIVAVGPVLAVAAAAMGEGHISVS